MNCSLLTGDPQDEELKVRFENFAMRADKVKSSPIMHVKVLEVVAPLAITSNPRVFGTHGSHDTIDLRESRCRSCCM